MKKLYRYIDIPNLSVIVEELKQFYNVNTLNCKKAESWSLPYNTIKPKTPALTEFLERSRVPVRLLKYYSVPPNGRLAYHVDGPIDIPGQCPPFSFNIPLLNYDNTYIHWYNCPLDNLKQLTKTNKTGNSYMIQEGFFGNAFFPVDKTQLVEIGKAEVNRPMIIKTDLVHCATNPNPETLRVIAGIRLDLYNKTQPISEFEEIFDTTGLTIDSADG